MTPAQAPDQPPVSSVPNTVPPADSLPIPPPPSVSAVSSAQTTPVAVQPASPNAIPPAPTQPPPPPAPSSITYDQSSGGHKRFPFMMVTAFVAVTLASFAGSFLFFRFKNTPAGKSPVSVAVTPPVTFAPTAISTPSNPFSTTSADLTVNPFASPTAAVNPFGAYRNPFTGSTVSATPATYQNPFTNQK